MLSTEFRPPMQREKSNLDKEQPNPRFQAIGSVVLAALLLASLPPVAQAWPTRQLDPNIVVRIADLEPGQHVRGRHVLRGYAADRRSPDGPGLNPDDIQIYVNDTSLSPDLWNLADFADANQENPAAAAELGARFARAGFVRTLELCSFPTGPQTITVWVSSQIAPGARNYATVNVYVDPCDEGTVMRREGSRTITVQDASRYTPTTGVYRDFAVGVDARCPEEANCRVGLNFRRVPGPGNGFTNSYYRFSIHPRDGQFALSYWPGGEGQRGVAMIPFTTASLIRRGTATNRLAVIAQGDWIRLFVNGHKLGEVRDDRRGWGHIDPNAEVHGTDHELVVAFENFVVSTPGQPQLLEAVGAPQVIASAASAPSSRGQLSLGQPMRGQLRAGGSDRYTFTANAGDQLNITLNRADNSNFDPYLILIGPDGRTIAEDDDSGGDLNSLIQTRLPSGGTYTVVARGYGDTSGAYVLIVSRR